MHIRKLTTIFCYALFLCFDIHAQNWSQITTFGQVPELKNHSAVYDPINFRMLVFGGRTLTGNSNELWSLSFFTYTWTKIIPNGNSPTPRYTQNAYFDSVNNRMIIWSGQGAELYNDVWAYSVDSNSWIQLWPDGNTSGVPLKRYGTGSVFDPVTRNIFTFAGFTTSGRFEDTWTFQTDSTMWTERIINPHPPKRCLHMACFASDLRRMVIYGGQDTGPLDDIWSLNLNNYTWQNITPSLRPSGRFWGSIIYPGNGTIVLFGGLGTNQLGDMWKFIIGTGAWEQINQGSNPPPARWGHTAIYVPQGDWMIIFGGEGAASYRDTWQFTNVSAIGIKPISQNIPDKFSLGQNYPNPFNPKTSIRFSIPKAASVKLIVYDMEGGEVARLVDKEMNPGSYTVDFDASSLSSGVYFYKLTSGGNAYTKKMVIMK